MFIMGIKTKRTLRITLKEQSHPCVSKLTSADVRLAMGPRGGQFCDVIGSRHEFRLKPGTDLPPEIVQ